MPVATARRRRRRRGTRRCPRAVGALDAQHAGLPAQRHELEDVGQAEVLEVAAQCHGALADPLSRRTAGRRGRSAAGSRRCVPAVALACRRGRGRASRRGSASTVSTARSPAAMSSDVAVLPLDEHLRQAARARVRPPRARRGRGSPPTWRPRGPPACPSGSAEAMVKPSRLTSAAAWTSGECSMSASSVRASRSSRAAWRSRRPSAATGCGAGAGCGCATGAGAGAGAASRAAPRAAAAAGCAVRLSARPGTTTGALQQLVVLVERRRPASLMK